MKYVFDSANIWLIILRCTDVSIGIWLLSQQNIRLCKHKNVKFQQIIIIIIQVNLHRKLATKMQKEVWHTHYLNHWKYSKYFFCKVWKRVLLLLYEISVFLIEYDFANWKFKKKTHLILIFKISNYLSSKQEKKKANRE